MRICQIPDYEHGQTQRERRNQVRGEDREQVANSWSHAPPQLEEDRGPDGGRHQYARCENPVGDVQYSRKSGNHDPHARDVAADDDRPQPPPLERLFSAIELVLGQADVPPITSAEWAPAPSA